MLPFHYHEPSIGLSTKYCGKIHKLRKQKALVFNLGLSNWGSVTGEL